ncbi:histidine kinase [Streptomyces diastatochromogenes]|nr:histidine kinase [Streptomyces diastatochromogenes]
MRTVIRTAMVRAWWRGWLFSLAGALLALPPLAVALVSAPPGRPAALRVAGFALGFAVVVAVMALPGAARRGCVRLVNGLLAAGVPAPLEPARSPWARRLRTAAWLLLHLTVGPAVAFLTLLWMFAGLTLPAAWLGDGGDVAVLVGTVPAPHGWRGAWTLPAGALCLATAGCLAAWSAAALRRAARLLLGHGPAERLADAEERMRTLAVRNRLAQDLHDSIGHTLTSSTIQAAAALELWEQDPEAARRAVSTIEETSRAAMDDLDHVVGILREEPGTARPQATLADLGTLAGQVRAAGASLTLETEGDLARVPATVSREAYRIVQEALTNALKHGTGTGIRVRAAVRRAVSGWR